MNRIYHILGSDIPHHNRTVLSFFQNELLPKLQGQDHRFYVVGKANLSEEFASLDLTLFPTKKAVAEAVTQTAKAEQSAKFVLHGQFNFAIWWAIFCGKLPPCRCVWHVWGADLYEDSTSWKFKLAYPFRRWVQRKLPTLWATRGDLAFAQRHLKREGKADQVVYFPTKMPNLPTLASKTPTGKITILLGNSGDRSNRHLEALGQIKQAFGEAVRVVVPMGYPENNHAYIEEVQQQAVRLFPQNAVEILRERLDFERYLAVLAECELGYFIFERQQGIGTICLLTQLNIPTVLHRNNPFVLDMQAEKIPFLFADQLSAEKVGEAKIALQQLDKTQIGFFAPNYSGAWLRLLTELAHP